MSLGSKRGFTIIELLVVIAVIGLMSSIVTAALNSARKNTRNARRNADIKQLANAFNLGHDSGSDFPVTWPVTACVSATCYGGFSGSPAIPAVDTFLAPYLVAKPADPPDATRVFGGNAFGAYLYQHIRPPITIGPDSYTAGAYILWYLEPVPGVSCGPGKIFFQAGTWLVCIQKLD